MLRKYLDFTDIFLRLSQKNIYKRASQPAFRLVGWHFPADDDRKMAETIFAVPRR